MSYKVPINIMEEIVEILDATTAKYKTVNKKPSYVKRAKKMSDLLKSNYTVLNDVEPSQTKS